MAFSRSWLKGYKLDEDVAEAIMAEHVAVTTALIKERDTYKAEADKVPGLQEKLKAQSDNEDYKAKFESEHQAFESFKAKTAQDAEAAKVSAAYRRLLTEEKVSEKRFDVILKVTDLSGMKLDKDGNLTGAEKIRESIRTEWADFIVKKAERGADDSTPPDPDHNTFETMSLAEKMQFANAHPSDPAVAAWLNK